MGKGMDMGGNSSMNSSMMMGTGRTSFFVPHPHFDDEINRNLCQSEIEGGVWMAELPVGAVIEVETRNRLYRVENRGSGQVMIHGHYKFCPRPVLVDLHGSTWGRSMLKTHFIGRGMYIEFHHPEYGIIRTSKVQEIRQVA